MFSATPAAKWATLVSAVLYIAYLLLALQADAVDSGIVVQGGLTFAQAIAWSVALWQLRELAVALRADPAILRYVAILVTLVVATGLCWYPAQASGDNLLLISLYFSLVALTGIAYILLGACLLRVPDAHRGLRLFAWMAVASGMCMMVVVALIVAVPFILIAHGALWSLFRSYESTSSAAAE